MAVGGQVADTLTTDYALQHVDHAVEANPVVDTAMNLGGRAGLYGLKGGLIVYIVAATLLLPPGSADRQYRLSVIAVLGWLPALNNLHVIGNE